jgi:hypothetical protein
MKLLPGQRSAILQAARDADASAKVVPIRVSWKPLKVVLVTFSAAAVITLVALVLGRIPVGGSSIVKTPAPAPSNEMSLEVALVPAPGPPDAAAPVNEPGPSGRVTVFAKAAAVRSAAMEQKGEMFLKRVAECVSTAPIPKDSDFPQLRPRGEVAAASQPSLALPVQAGISSLIWITRMVREEGKRPALNAVRPEEILNHFSLRPAGTTSVAQGVSLSVETTTCPWKPSALLLLVSFRGSAEASSEVSARFVANAANVRHYRLLGFSPMTHMEDSPLPTRLPAKTVTSLAIEIDSSTSADELGSIEWSVNGTTAPTMALTRNSDAEPSDDARFAALVCTYAEWLIDQPAGKIDKEMLAALARESSSSALSPDRADFLTLIEQSLAL